jgi:hypothetical protein
MYVYGITPPIKDPVKDPLKDPVEAEGQRYGKQSASATSACLEGAPDWGLDLGASESGPAFLSGLDA